MARREYPYFRTYAKDILSDLTYKNLSFEEKGILHELLLRYWVERYLPADHGELAQWLDTDRETIDNAMMKFNPKFKLNRAGDKYICTGLNAQYKKCKEYSRKQSENAKKRYGKDTGNK